MAIAWYYSVNSNKHGPVTSAELKRLADKGELSPADLVWKEGLTAWVAASGVKGLFANAPSTLSTVPPQPAIAAAPPPFAQSPSTSVSPKPQPAASDVAGGGALPLHKQRMAIAGAALLGGLSTFMPWATLPIVGAIDGTAGDGWITLALFAVALGVALTGSRGQAIYGWPQLAAIVVPLIASLIGASKIYSIIAIASNMGATADSDTLRGAMAGLVAQTVRPKFGLYLLVATGIATAASAIALSPQRISIPKTLPLPGHMAIPRSMRLPLHIQRMAVLGLSLLGAAATFMPWVKPVDSGPVLRIKASVATPAEIAVAHAVNSQYCQEMAKHMGTKAETLRDIQSATGTRLAGVFTFAMFAAAISLCFHGIRTRPINDWTRLLVLVLPLIASSVGAWEVLQVGVKDKAVRAAVQEYVRESGHSIDLPRLSQPVMQSGYGLWVITATGIATSAAFGLLQSVAASDS